MKQSYLALFLLVILGLCSCRKDDNDIDIRTYDANQITDYIKTNGLTNMKPFIDPETNKPDTSGIYYEILSQGPQTAAKKLDYPSQISYVSSFKSFDGGYNVTDTISNHAYIYVGNTTPPGLQYAIYKIAKYKGTRIRLLIPSRLAYGNAGLGTGSSRLKGNQSIDYYVNILDEAGIAAYDDIAIKKYMAANNLTGYTAIPSTVDSKNIVYRKITQAGNGTVVSNLASTLNVQYTGLLLNGTIFEQYNDQESGNVGAAFVLQDLIQGWKDSLTGLTGGAQVSIIMPSKLAYGVNPQTQQNSSGATVISIPSTSCLRFDMNILTVTN